MFKFTNDCIFQKPIRKLVSKNIKQSLIIVVQNFWLKLLELLEILERALIIEVSQNQELTVLSCLNKNFQVHRKGSIIDQKIFFNWVDLYAKKYIHQQAPCQFYAENTVWCNLAQRSEISKLISMTTSGALEPKRISTLIYDTPQNSLSAAVDVAINSYSGLMNGLINFTFFYQQTRSW